MVSVLKKEQANEVKKKDYCIAELNKNRREISSVPPHPSQCRLASDGKKRQGDRLGASLEEPAAFHLYLPAPESCFCSRS